MQGDLVRARDVDGDQPVAALNGHAFGAGAPGADIHNVRLLERFTFVEVPAARADEVVDKVNGSDVRGVKLRLEVAGKR